MTETRYFGKVVDGHIFLICVDDNGNRIQCPHVEIFVNEGLAAFACPANSEPKAPFKFLTKREVALFFNGMDINGNLLEKPSEWHARHDREHAEKMANDEEYRKNWEAMQKDYDKSIAKALKMLKKGTDEKTVSEKCILPMFKVKALKLSLV